MSAAKRIRVVVVEDEPLARSGICRLLAQDDSLAVVAECATGREAVKAIMNHEPDLVFLDIQMPDLDGFEVLRAIGAERMPRVIFATAFDKFATRAFDVSAVDYLLKPFDDERFLLALKRAKAAIDGEQERALAARFQVLLDLLGERGEAVVEGAKGAAPTTRLVVKNQGKTVMLRIEDIDWIEADDYHVIVHSLGRSYQMREALSSLEARLDPTRFFRAHRSALVNLDRIRELQPSFNGEHVLILADGSRTLLTRSRRIRLEQMLRQRL
jgi:two-component system LytT family response regulator